LVSEYGNGITSHILYKESWDALQDVESWGITGRDLDDEFKGAEFRGVKTKLTYNTWYACTIVDANGKEVPWVDRKGNVLQTVSERCHRVSGQRTFVQGRRGPFELWGADPDTRPV
jgi:hypothetical protein